MPSDLHSRQVVDLLRSAGWYPGRNVPWKQPSDLPEAFDLARRILEEFGGLRVGQVKTGIDCAASDIEFDAELGSHLGNELTAYGLEIGAALYPLGEVHRGHCYLLVDERGRVFLLAESELLPVSLSFSGGIEKILLGKKSGFESI